MSWVAKREALDGGDLDNWAQYEQAHNHLAIGANTIDLFLSGGTLYARKGKIGLFDDTQYYAITNSADAAISLAGLTASCWAKVEISVSGGSTVVVAIASIAGDTNPCKLPATFTAAYDPAKGGYYIAATKRCIGVVFLDSTGAVVSISNATAPVERKRTYDSPFPLFCAMPWFKNLAARSQVATFSGTCTTDLSMALKNTGANFTTVTVGDIVQNTASKAFATVLYKISTDTLMLDADIFPAGTETYKVWAKPVLAQQEGMAGFIELTGALVDGDGVKVADTDTANHLKDADGTDWTTVATANQTWAMNLATGKVALVTVVAAHDLTLQWDAFPNGNEKYMLFAGIVTISDVESPINGVVIPEMNIGGRYFGGGLTAGNTEDDGGQGHRHTTRDTSGGAGSNWGVALTSVVVGAVQVGPVLDTQTDGVNGTPRIGDHAQPRTLRATMIMRIK